MRASAFEFRHRLLFILAIFALGFTAPWNRLPLLAPHLAASGPNAHLWGLLAIQLSKTGILSIGAAFNAVLAAGILSAFAGAFLRTWASAWLGVSVMRDAQLHADRIVADGPYRRLRNPLYLGLSIFTLALALLMPPSGALFTVLALAAFELRLILAEEAAFAAQQSAPEQSKLFAAYCAAVPRLVPALTPRTTPSGTHPRWTQAFLAEIFFWGTAASFAALGWRYNALLLDQAVLVSFGVSLIANAFLRPSAA